VKSHDPTDQEGALAKVAKRLFWWLQPEEALRNEVRFLAQVMALGTWEDVALTHSAYPVEVWKSALYNAPAGVIDPRSWNFWQIRLGMTPMPPMPSRHFA
jgi:hypothetical protein